MSEQMQRIHDKIAECDREAELRGWDTSGFPRLWFAALSRVAGLDLQERRRKARHPDDGSIPSPVTRDTSPGICELQKQNDELQAEIARLREERRWISVGEGLPEIGTNVLAMGSEGVFQACLTLCGESRRWEALVLDVHGCGCCGGGRPYVTHWMPLPPGPEGK